jgi:hypothetical protein
LNYLWGRSNNKQDKEMKNILTKQFYTSILILLTIVVPFGCKHSLKDRIIGKWDYQTVTVNGQTFQGRQLSSPQMEFKSNGVVETITGNIKTEEHWDLKGDTLVFTGEKQPHYMKIKLFSAEHLVLESLGEITTTITLAPSKGENPMLKSHEEEEAREKKEKH